MKDVKKLGWTPQFEQAVASKLARSLERSLDALYHSGYDELASCAFLAIVREIEQQDGFNFLTSIDGSAAAFSDLILFKHGLVFADVADSVDFEFALQEPVFRMSRECLKAAEGVPLRKLNAAMFSLVPLTMPDLDLIGNHFAKPPRQELPDL